MMDFPIKLCYNGYELSTGGGLPAGHHREALRDFLRGGGRADLSGKTGAIMSKEKKEKKEKKPKAEKAPKMKKCPGCQEEIPKKAKVCPHCAAKQKGGPLPLIIALAAVVLAAGAAVSVFVFHFPIDPPFGGPSISDTVLGAGMELTEEQEEAVLAVLETCGFTQITEVRELSDNGITATYAIEDTQTSRFLEGGDIVAQVADETKTVESIVFGEKDIYLSGHLIAPITDFYLSSAQRDVYLSACLTAVRARLDLPETAVFPSKSGWEYTMDGSKVSVRSTVTAKDTTGQEVKRAFQAEFEDGSFVSISFEGGGTEAETEE